jgi:hypothetical protein
MITTITVVSFLLGMVCLGIIVSLYNLCRNYEKVSGLSQENKIYEMIKSVDYRNSLQSPYYHISVNKNLITLIRFSRDRGFYVLHYQLISIDPKKNIFCIHWLGIPNPKPSEHPLTQLSEKIKELTDGLPIYIQKPQTQT